MPVVLMGTHYNSFIIPCLFFEDMETAIRKCKEIFGQDPKPGTWKVNKNMPTWGIADWHPAQRNHIMQEVLFDGFSDGMESECDYFFLEEIEFGKRFYYCCLP